MSTLNIIKALNDPTTEFIVTEWFNMRHTPEGRRIRGLARTTFADVSATYGGGLNPYLFTTEDASAKLSHNAIQAEWKQIIIYMAAHRSAGPTAQGLQPNLCPYATPACIKGCLGHTSGRMVMPPVQRAQKVRTQFLHQHPADFAICLLDEAERHARAAKKMGGMRLAARLNGTSDIPWERAPWLIDLVAKAGVEQLQDYTKWKRGRRDTTGLAIPYYLAQSITEHHRPDDVQPGDVVVVDTPPNGDLPNVWNGMPTIDGDYEHGDLRFLDAIHRPDAVVLLRAKGSLRGVKGEVGSFVKPSVVRNLKLAVA